MKTQQQVLLSATELAAQEIRTRIRTGELQPGERINGDVISQTLGVSRTPVRDALQILRTEGLVEIQARVGAFVREITGREVSEVYSLKLAIEPLAASWAAEHGTTTDRGRLQSAVDALAKSAEENDVDTAVESVELIHSLIFEMTGSEVIRGVYRVFEGRVKIFREINLSQPGRLTVSARKHGKIVDAICSGDPQASAAAMKDHLGEATNSLKEVLS